MKIGILTTGIGKFGEKGVYNSQQIGLAKALSFIAESVVVYRLVPLDRKEHIERVEGYKNIRVHLLPSKQLGINGFPDLRRLNIGLDALICCSDTQLCFPAVYRWAMKHSVKIFAYIGVLESHSTNRLKRGIINLLVYRNLRIYRKIHCLAKTPTVKKQLKKYGYQDEDKVILFVGRMIEEKKPLQMIEVFAELLNKDENYRLLMVGKGELKSKVREEVQKRGFTSKTTLIEVMPNSEVLELYQFAHAFVNLNEQEIFGMAILEAMYYNCKVVAMRAPGPNFIIENGISGWLVSSRQEIAEKVEEALKDEQGPHNRIMSRFTWDYTAKAIERLLD